MSRNSTLEKYREKLFDPQSELQLSPTEEIRLKRLKDIYVQWLEDPLLTRVQLRDYIKLNHVGLSESQIYRDLNDVYVLFANVQNASRAHLQYIVNETLIETINELKGTKKHYKELIMAIDKLAKYNQMDKDAPEPVDWGEAVDFEIEPTSDPSALGIEPKTEEELDTLKAKLYKKMGDVEDVEFIELNKTDGKKT